MPRKRHRNRLIPSVTPTDRVAILAGLRGEKHRQGMSLFPYWAGFYPARDNRRWPEVKAVFQSLPHAERRSIIRKRREGMTGRIWIDYQTGRIRRHGELPDYKPPPNDPRLLFASGDDAA